jgi:hypothetical protein
MTFACTPSTEDLTDCTLEDLIAEQVSLAGAAEVYTGGLARKCDSQASNNSPRVPYAVLEEQNAPAGQRIGFTAVRYQVAVRLRVFTTSSHAGQAIVQDTRARLQAERCLMTNLGPACYNRLSGRPRSVQAAECLWMTQATLVFWVVEPLC